MTGVVFYKFQFYKTRKSTKDAKRKKTNVHVSIKLGIAINHTVSLLHQNTTL